MTKKNEEFRNPEKADLYTSIHTCIYKYTSIHTSVSIILEAKIYYAIFYYYLF